MPRLPTLTVLIAAGALVAQAQAGVPTFGQSGNGVSQVDIKFDGPAVPLGVAEPEPVAAGIDWSCYNGQQPVRQEPIKWFYEPPVDHRASATPIGYEIPQPRIGESCSAEPSPKLIQSL